MDVQCGWNGKKHCEHLEDYIISIWFKLSSKAAYIFPYTGSDLSMTERASSWDSQGLKHQPYRESTHRENIPWPTMENPLWGSQICTKNTLTKDGGSFYSARSATVYAVCSESAAGKNTFWGHAFLNATKTAIYYVC